HLFNSRSIIIWDSLQKKPCKKLDFPQKIRSIQFYKYIFVASTSKMISVFDTQQFNIIKTFDTFDNKISPFTASQLKNFIICFPDPLQLGNINVYFKDKDKTVSIHSHHNKIQYM